MRKNRNVMVLSLWLKSFKSCGSEFTIVVSFVAQYIIVKGNFSFGMYFVFLPENS